MVQNGSKFEKGRHKEKEYGNLIDLHYFLKEQQVGEQLSQ
jgi:hypothetical protein